MMKVTIRTIAERSGVSRGTVDRVLHNRPNVKPDIRERVQVAIRELGYTPNLTARALARSGVRKTIGVLVPHWPEGSFDREISRGFSDAAELIRENGIELNIQKTNGGSPGVYADHLEACLNQAVNGLIICARHTPEMTAWINRFAAADIPVITINSDLPDSRRHCYIGENQLQCGAIAADILHKFKRTAMRILVISGSFVYSGHLARTTGFIEALSLHGIGEDQLEIRECHNDYDQTYAAVSAFLKEHPGHQGIYMASESVEACAKAIQAAGRKHDTMVIFHDLSPANADWMKRDVLDFCIDQNLYDQAFRAVTHLADYLTLGTPIPSGIQYMPPVILTASALS